MNYQEILDKIKPQLEKLEEDFKGQLREIRSGRLLTALVEDIKADCFGQELPLKQLGAVTTPSQKEILVQLWDKSYVEGVVKAIERKNIGLGVRVEGRDVYLTAPPLTQETKKNLIKLLNQRKEEIFQNIRHIRDKAWKELQEGERTGEIREDDKFRGKDKLEELVKEFREKIEELVETKEKEIEG